jgi:putative PIN family toxin of toxin-antitoxin system
VRGEIKLLTSLALLKELEKVLKEKFNLGENLLRDFLELVRTVTKIVKPRSHMKVILYPPGDNRVVECAVGGKAEFIATGDTGHILPLKEHQGVRILSPSQFAKILPPALP